MTKDSAVTVPGTESGPQLYWLAVSAAEAELIMDSFKVSSSLTRGLVLKVAGLVLEIAAAGHVVSAEAQVSDDSARTAAEERLRSWRNEHPAAPGGA